MMQVSDSGMQINYPTVQTYFNAKQLTFFGPLEDVGDRDQRRLANGQVNKNEMHD